MQQMYSITLNIHAKSNLRLYFLFVSDRLYLLELCARFYLKLRLDSFPILQQFRHKQHFILRVRRFLQGRTLDLYLF